MSVQVSYRKQSLFGIILLLCIFSIFETGSRFYEFFLQDCGIDEYDYFLTRYICYDQQSLVYQNQPVLSIIPNQHLTTININNEGFRGAEINVSKTNNDYRIIMIGGSTVFGAGMPNDNLTIPYQLNKKFEEKYNNVEVINAGISSITSFEELYHFKEKLIHLEPNLVIIYDGANNVHQKRTSDPEILNMDKDKFQMKDFQKYLRSPVVMYRHVLLPIINSGAVNTLDVTGISTTSNSSIHNSLQIPQLITSLWHDHMKEFCQISNEKQIKSIVIIQPSLDQDKKSLSDYEYSIYTKNILDKKIFDMLIQKSEKLTSCSGVYDFTNVFENTDFDVYMDRVHLNELGNKMIANNIYEKILPIVLEDISK
jgi:lysophospholipase L1-like esterase